MDRSTRWETEAIRSSSRERPSTPRPSAKRRTARPSKNADWVTLREAAEATGIPLNTLRKWVRKKAIDSYLESDGELTLRMVDLGSIRDRAEELGRDIPAPATRTEPADAPESGPRHEATGGDDSQHVTKELGPTEDTMLVPVDAWNKMLAQLGNLHEAGQQLADARERAAKAETEAAFLRDRLRELRESSGGDRGSTIDDPSRPTHVSDETEGADQAPATPASPTPDTTTYWRYLTSGWRHRKRRSG